MSGWHYHHSKGAVDTHLSKIITFFNSLSLLRYKQISVFELPRGEPGVSPKRVMLSPCIYTRWNAVGEQNMGKISPRHDSQPFLRYTLSKVLPYAKRPIRNSERLADSIWRQSEITKGLLYQRKHVQFEVMERSGSEAISNSLFLACTMRPTSHIASSPYSFRTKREIRRDTVNKNWVA